MLIEEDLLNRCYIERIISGGNAQYSQYTDVLYHHVFLRWQIGGGLRISCAFVIHLQQYNSHIPEEYYHDALMRYYEDKYLVDIDSLVVY